MSVSTTCDRASAQRRTEHASMSWAVRVEPVRLKGDDDAAGSACGGIEHGADFRRMVTVVVDDEDAARFAADLEPALGAAKLAQTVGDPLERQPEPRDQPLPPPARSERLWRPGTLSVRGVPASSIRRAGVVGGALDASLDASSPRAAGADRRDAERSQI